MSHESHQGRRPAPRQEKASTTLRPHEVITLCVIQSRSKVPAAQLIEQTGSCDQGFTMFLGGKVASQD